MSDIEIIEKALSGDHFIEHSPKVGEHTTLTDVAVTYFAKRALAALAREGRIVPEGVTLVQKWESAFVNEHGDDWDVISADDAKDAQSRINDYLKENGTVEDSGGRLIVRKRWELDSKWEEHK